MGIAEGKWAEGSGGGRSSWVSERKDGRQVSTEVRYMYMYTCIYVNMYVYVHVDSHLHTVNNTLNS
jgi:hypothetical protein